MSSLLHPYLYDGYRNIGCFCTPAHLCLPLKQNDVIRLGLFNLSRDILEHLNNFQSLVLLFFAIFASFELELFVMGIWTSSLLCPGKIKGGNPTTWLSALKGNVQDREHRLTVGFQKQYSLPNPFFL